MSGVPYFQDEAVTLHHGDALAVLSTMPDASVDCCVTSPPYFGLRDYGVEGQYGLEASPAEYVETMRALFAEVRRVLTDDGTLWLNIGDSYAKSVTNNGGYSTSSTLRGRPVAAHEKGVVANYSGNRHALAPGLPSKNLLGIPWRTAFALQDDGWILRNDIIWAKPNAMPESVTDRLSSRHEHLFMLSKSRSYWFGLDAVREPLAGEYLSSGVRNPRFGREGGLLPGERRGEAHDRPANDVRGLSPSAFAGALNPLGRNPGDVWTVATQPFSEAHFAVMPQALAERAILAGCKPGGVVLDPFSGSGTTGLAATKHGRRYVGIDLSADYLDLSLRTRFAQPGLDLTGGVA